MPCRAAFPPDGYGTASDSIRSIDFARENGARIINASWGGYGEPSMLELEAIQRARAAGILFVAAAGNESLDNDQVGSYPADFNAVSGNVISVGATDAGDRLASFSNYGLRSVDIAAPGSSILSTLPWGYGRISGTSMAAPHVSGAAALLLSQNPKLTYADVKLRLLDAADRKSAVSGRVVTGRLNAAAALRPREFVPPGAPRTLRLARWSAPTLRLTWTASGDDGTAGTGAAYELRYSRTPITTASFPKALAVAQPPVPARSGTTQRFVLSGLSRRTAYYVALRAVDDAGNVSPLVTAGPVSTLP